jgi:hypothetical protein
MVFSAHLADQVREQTIFRREESRPLRRSTQHACARLSRKIRRILCASNCRKKQRNDSPPTRKRTRTRQSRLAGDVSHVFIRRLPRPEALPLSRAAPSTKTVSRPRIGSARTRIATGKSSPPFRQAHRRTSNMGNGSVIRHGDVQRKSTGRGLSHSEFNHSETEPVHLLQIWILPETKGPTPSYEEKHFKLESLRGKLRLIASRKRLTAR